MLNTTINPKNRIKIRRIALVLLAILIGAGLTYWSINHFTRVDNGAPSSKPPTISSPSSPVDTSQGRPKTDPATAPSLDAFVTPSAPSGTFVSNHHPNLSGSPAPNTLTSTCTSTPGSSCTINFTKGSAQLSLPSHTLDADGNTSWDWNLRDIGLTTGEWKVTATAANGGKTASSSDSLNLVIGE